MALEYVFIPTERWGDPIMFASLADLEDAIACMCEDSDEFEYPEDGLRPGRDYECRWAESGGDEYGDWADSPYSD